MQYQIRAMRVGEVLDTGINLTKNHFGLLFGIAAISLIPISLVTGIIQASAPTTQTIFGPMPDLSGGAALLVNLLNIVNGFVIAPIANAAIIYAISSVYLSQPVTIGEAFRHALKRWGAFVGTWILMFLAVLGGTILLVIPGIIFAFWFALSQHVAVLENRSGGEALGRSKALMKGNIGSIFVLGLLVAVISIGIVMVVGLIPSAHVRVIILALLNVVITVFTAACFVVFYFSCRCKYENFDLQVLAAAVEEE